MTRTILVLGTHRSGTSTVAGVLHRLGVNMGSQLLGASEANPWGHYEDLSFLRLNDSVVGDWRDPKPEPTDSELGIYANLCTMRNRVFPVWGVKDPRLAFTADYILPHLDDPVFVCVHRSVDRIVESLAEREGWTAKQAESVTDRYLSARNRLLADNADLPRFHIQYEELCSMPIRSTRNLLSVLPVERAAAFVKG